MMENLSPISFRQRAARSSPVPPALVSILTPLFLGTHALDILKLAPGHSSLILHAQSVVSAGVQSP